MGLSGQMIKGVIDYAKKKKNKNAGSISCNSLF
jgi:hypothetical protein